IATVDLNDDPAEHFPRYLLLARFIAKSHQRVLAGGRQKGSLVPAQTINYCITFEEGRDYSNEIFYIVTQIGLAAGKPASVSRFIVTYGGKPNLMEVNAPNVLHGTFLHAKAYEEIVARPTRIDNAGAAELATDVKTSPGAAIPSIASSPAAPDLGVQGQRAAVELERTDGVSVGSCSADARTISLGVVGKYGTRYGASLRKQVKKMEITQHAKARLTEQSTRAAAPDLLNR
ncbi:MAG: hypothetical protein BJ554DRAFT_920, partial [Olpidium bornovanus]